MARGRRRERKRGPSGAGLTVCRGCCCGTVRKHPDTDHDAQLAALRAAAGPAGRVRVTDCLDACAHSNVVVVSPSAQGRAAGARPVWLEGVLGAEATAEVVDWVEAGGPGVADPPGLLDLSVFTPSRRSRVEAGER